MGLAVAVRIRTIAWTMSQPFDITAQSTAEAVRAVASAVAASDFQRATKLADEALSRGLVHPAFFNARALRFEREERNEEALLSYQQARALTPGDARLLNAIGLCEMRLHRLEEALGTFDEAIRVDPNYAATHHRKGIALGLAGRLEASEYAHARAVQLQPHNAEALASLATIAARKGDAKSARFNAERALRITPRDATAHAALALIELSQAEFAAAERRLTPLLAAPQLVGHGRAVVQGLLGDALDGLSRPDEAFSAYNAANEEQRRLHAPRFQGKPGAISSIEELTAQFATAAGEMWQKPKEGGNFADGPSQHVFLLGFHRSGTTLLEQALESHPGIATLDERDFLREEADRYLGSAAGIELLATLDGEALETARAAYWSRVRNHGIDVQGKVFVDKHPFNTIKLPLILKLFPDAKVLFALRDPRDVVLSCFRRQFDVDLIRYEFLTLEGAARLYDRVMAFAELCRAKLPLALFQHRYEDLIADFDNQTRRVCDFIGIKWDESMRDFAVTARALDAHAASAGQVRRGLYSEGVGQWRRYRSHLEPVMPLLQPWVERFGYSDG
jgi:Tfp pilus assembly protein PilF